MSCAVSRFAAHPPRARRRLAARGAPPPPSRRVRVARASFSGFDADSPDASHDASLLSRLHVNFLALRRGSRFAAQEFALVALEAYERGVTVPSLRMDVSLLGLSTASHLGLSEQDAFVSHASVCLLTLWELRWPSPGGGPAWCPLPGEGGPEEDREARGLLAYIRATHARADAGFDLRRLEMERVAALQARAADGWEHPEGWADTQTLAEKGGTTSGPPPSSSSPSSRPPSFTSRGIAAAGRSEASGALGETAAVLLMRVNCKLTLLLKEFVELERREAAERAFAIGEGVPKESRASRESDDDTVRDDDDASSAGEGFFDSSEVGESDDDGLDAGGSFSPQVALEWCATPRTAARVCAARALSSYVSALSLHPVGLRQFAAAALDAHLAGVPASALSLALHPAEFDVETSRRGMFGSSADATKFFALFASTAYVVFQESGAWPDELMRGRGPVVSSPTSSLIRSNAAAKLDPDVWAWAPAPGDPEGLEPVGWAAVDAGLLGEEAADEREEARRLRVAGMRASVVAWMELDRGELARSVDAQLSVDEEDRAFDAGASFDEFDDVMRGAEGAPKPPGEGPKPPGDLAWERDEFLANSSVTIAALTMQRAVVRFALTEIEERRRNAEAKSA
jgi:hypothetical protein